MPNAPPPPAITGASPWRDVMLTNPFFSQMRPDALSEFIAMSTERKVGKATRVYSKGDPGGFMVTVLRGRIRLLSASRDGREVTLGLIGPGEVLGQIALLDGKPRNADALAVEETVMLITERRVFLPFLAAHRDLSDLLLVALCGRLRRAFGALEDIALFDLPARLARLLIQLAETHSQPGTGSTRIAGRMSQRELANLVFSSRESVNKQLRIWREAGVLTMTAGHIVVHDMASLRRALER
jgi:CRP-like cAMP-binding protein